MKLCTHISLQVLHPSTLSKILLQCQFIIPRLHSPFVLLRQYNLSEHAELPWAVSLLPVPGSYLILTFRVFWTLLPPVCLCLFLAAGPQGLPPPASLGAPCPFFHSSVCLGSFWSLLLFRHLLPMLSVGIIIITNILGDPTYWFVFLTLKNFSSSCFLHRHILAICKVTLHKVSLLITIMKREPSIEVTPVKYFLYLTQKWCAW